MLGETFSVEDGYEADEAWVRGTFGGLRPVVSVDGPTIGRGGAGRVPERLSELYRDAMYGETA